MRPPEMTVFLFYVLKFFLIDFLLRIFNFMIKVMDFGKSLSNFKIC